MERPLGPCSPGLPVPPGRLWLHAPGDVADGRMLYPGPEWEGLAAFCGAAAAAGAALHLPYLGVWDRHGSPVYAGDLVVYYDEHPVGAVEITQNGPVLGLARHRLPQAAGRGLGAAHVPRRHYDVLQLTEARITVLLDTDGGDHTRRLERWTLPVRFWRDEHGYDGGEVLWHRVGVRGNAFEHPGLLDDWGLGLDVDDVVELLRVR